jgi:dihydroflavonol-4-reductase
MNLVTGATGLVGSHMLYELIKNGEDAIALYRTTRKKRKVREVFSIYSGDNLELYKKIQWIKGDVTDFHLLNKSFNGIKHVYHCAGMISFNPADRDEMFRINIEGTANVVKAAIKNGVSKICHVSTTGFYEGKKNNIDEETVVLPKENENEYELSKYYAEMEVWKGIAGGLNAIIVNPAIIVGPPIWDNGSSEFFSRIWSNMPFYVNGSAGFIDVRDVAKAMRLLMESDVYNERYILVSENKKYKEFFDLIAENLDKKKPNVQASKTLVNLLYYADYVLSKILKKEPLLHKGVINSIDKEKRYSNHKIIRSLGIDFVPLEESVRLYSSVFLEKLRKANRKKIKKHAL